MKDKDFKELVKSLKELKDFKESRIKIDPIKRIK